MADGRLLSTCSTASRCSGEWTLSPRPSDNEVWLRRWAAAYQTAPENQHRNIIKQMLTERPGPPTTGLPERLRRMTTTPLIRAAEERIADFALPELGVRNRGCAAWQAMAMAADTFVPELVLAQIRNRTGIALDLIAVAPSTSRRVRRLFVGRMAGTAC